MYLLISCGIKNLPKASLATKLATARNPITAASRTTARQFDGGRCPLLLTATKFNCTNTECLPNSNSKPYSKTYCCTNSRINAGTTLDKKSEIRYSAD